MPVSAPSLLLQRRPDIAAAERRAAAANAEIGVARAAFFPSIGLDASGGLQTAGGGASLLSAANTWWTLGPQAALAIFDGGRRKAGVAAARAQFNEASADYRSTVLAAFQEVEDNLALCNRLAVEARDQAAAGGRRPAHRGPVDDPLQAGRGDLSRRGHRPGGRPRRGAVGHRLGTRRLQASVDLVRALGGGWTVSQGAAAVAALPSS